MNKKIATKLIKELQDSLNAHNIKEQFWMDKVQAYVQAIFGDHTQSIALPMFGTYYGDRPYSGWSVQKTDIMLERLRLLFESYQVMISNGVFIRKNIFSRFSDLGVWGILISLVVSFAGFALWIGYNEGQRSIDCKVQYFEFDNRKLRDSLSVLSNSQEQDQKNEEHNENASAGNQQPKPGRPTDSTEKN